jgi:hypothetical protein
MLVLLPLDYGLIVTLNHLGNGERPNGTVAIVVMSLAVLESTTGTEKAMSTTDLLVGTTIAKTAL